ncbi:hypothetical protein [Oceanobacillus sp. J11TS1]|uniref:hypothetical protein n=1 Tax=Oceanobacillus sp. J11TS1 TaxID=2807191 RepID=UPI001B0D2639|nr:hypothetical protein [Oceanobacillus sp. J11TS1]GIO22835.1 hypothetical protein J11TS1_14160 [Oceanobacillus sp. J11TS1]
MKLNNKVNQINKTRDSFELLFEHKSHVKIQLFCNLFEELGWDYTHPCQSRFERPNIGENAATGVYLDHKLKPIILFETKGIKENIDTHIKQTSEYYSTEESVKVAILTNMVDMYFFSDFETPGVMDKTPFYKINFPSTTKQDLGFLELFEREYFLDHHNELYDKWKEQYLLLKDI